MIQWFKRHPKYLERESKALANDSNYKEILQCRDNTFLSHGEILVRLDQVYKHPVLIVYHGGTPYELPSVIPLKRALAKSEVEDLAKLQPLEAIERIRPEIEFYYQLRHQNNSGNLCLVEWENLDDGSHFFGIGSIIQRVRDWFAAHSTNNFPPEGPEVEYISHFNDIDKHIQVLIPELFYKDQFVEGTFYFRIFSNVPTRNSDEMKAIYVGLFADGFTKTGIMMRADVKMDPPFLHAEFKTSSDFYTRASIVESFVSKRVLLIAYWFEVNFEPRPFRTFRELVEILGENNFEKGKKRLGDRCLNALKSRPPEIFLALRFPNRRGSKDIQLFKVSAVSPLPIPILSQTTSEQINTIVASYDQVQAIDGEKFTEETYHQRNSKRADYTLLRNRTAHILGVGALGSEIADCLAKAGVGALWLVDNQSLKAQNSIRHLAGLDWTGHQKTTAVQEILEFKNPFVKTHAVTFNLFRLDGSDPSIDTNDICISSVADDNLESYINEQLVIHNKSVFYARALRGGKAARIFRVIPGKDACFFCLDLYRQEGRNFIRIPDDPTYPTLRNECNNPIRPASAADLKFVAALASKIVIEHLQFDIKETNHWIWSSESLEESGLDADTLNKQFIPPHEKCIYCYHSEKLTVIIAQTALETMQELIKRNPKIETGGVLVGKITNRTIEVVSVLGPGPKAIQKATEFKKDVDFCQKYLDEQYQKSGHQLVYVGEWHSHPSLNNSPSATDIRSLSEIAFQKDYLTENPLMIINTNTGIPSCTIHPVGKSYYKADHKIA